MDNEDGTDDKDIANNRVTTAANLFYNPSIISTTNVDMQNESSVNKSSENPVVSSNFQIEYIIFVNLYNTRRIVGF